MIGETVTVLRAGTSVDPYSGETVVRNWSTATEHNIAGCAFAPSGNAEQSSDWRLQALVSAPKLYAPPGADILATDRIRIRGLVYEVDGEPGDWRSPFTGQQMGLEVPLSKFGG